MTNPSFHGFRAAAATRCAARSTACAGARGAREQLHRAGAVNASLPLQARSTSTMGGAFMTAATLVGAVAAAAVMLAGCAGPGPQTAHHALMTDVASPSAPAAAASTPWPTRDWWSAWNDPQLSALIDRAVANQPSLQTVQARLAQAQSAALATGAVQRPQVNGQATFTDQRFTENSIYPPPFGGSTYWAADAQIAASWELDLFGERRAEVRSAIGLVRAGAAEAQAAQVLLAGNVAVAYVGLGRLVETRAVTEQAIEQRDNVLAIVRERTDAGLDSKIDLRQAEGSVAEARLQLQQIDESMARARHALAELTAQRPDALDTLTPQLAAVQPMPLGTELPADLLGRRADLAADRWRVEAALKQVDAARAQFYPNINLTAFVGLSSLGLSNFAQSGSRVYGAGPALRLPIFEGGRLRANLAGRNSEVDAAIDAYNGALLRALREVADELATLRSLDAQQRTQADAVAAAQGAYDLSLQRYRAGLGNFLLVLTAQTDVLAQRRGVAELQARRLTAEATLARALGGGYAGEVGLPTSAVATAAIPTAATPNAAIPTAAIATAAIR